MENVSAEKLSQLFLSGAYNLSNNKEYINELNVFPVPDGDTGTNMTLTIMAAATELAKLPEKNLDNITAAISSGSLKGARGNSGVILSQLIRGFCKDIKGRKELTVVDLASAFIRGTETAYKAVMKPKEGTILTVAKGISTKASELVEEDPEMDIVSFADQIIEYGDKVLLNTPEMLPVLKEAGVVDSGGQGLMEFLKGAVAALKGNPISLNEYDQSINSSKNITNDNVSNEKKSISEISTADIKYIYCTEFIIMLKEELPLEEVEKIKEYLLSIGDSLVCVADTDLVKIHVHTNHPGLAFEMALKYGELTRMKIDNMKEEHNERIFNEENAAAKNVSEDKSEVVGEDNSEASEEEAAEKKDFGFVQVAAGEGLCQILREIGVDQVISGGQTMNPSTEDILTAVNKVNAETVFVFPNNKNIILAAEQAALLSNNKKVIVIPSKTVPEGITAMLSFSDDMSAEENKEELTAALENVKTGEVTFSVRDTVIDGKSIKKDNIMGIGENGIAVVSEEIDGAALLLVDYLVDDETGLVTIYYGADRTKEEAESLGDIISNKYEDIEVEIHDGGQPVYYYLISVE